MNCSASAMLWTKSSWRMVVIVERSMLSDSNSLRAALTGE